MGKAAGTKRRGRKQFRYNVNRRTLLKKSRKMPRIKVDVVKMAYAENKGVRRNYKMMGLSSDPNRTIRIPSSQQLLEQSYMIKKAQKSSINTSKVKETKKTSRRTVADELERQANTPVDSTFHVSNEIALFAKYMTSKYGDDYKMMARDIRNHYQMTPKQIKRRINDYNASQMVTALKMAKAQS